ncbi:MAG: ImmA/IrrE family metallo-endopeptidase [Lachnospiraceae bacterium]|nr:ImmA/IrrE family metallo-endopeptidase [Lachnospiraceae bacterium]
MNYNDLLIEVEHHDIIVKEKPLKAYDGRIKGNKIFIRSNLKETQKVCVLAEELGHHHTTVGNILDQSDTGNQKQELRARIWAYNKLIGLNGIINAYRHGCCSLYDAANYLDVTEEFLSEALEYYKNKYGICTTIDNYVIYFEPSLGVFELL